MFRQTIIFAIGLASLVLGLLVARPGVMAETGGSNAVGTIAYYRGHEIRLVDTNGNNDRRLWGAPLPDPSFKGIRGLVWRPDGGALAFGSDYQKICSIYDSDIFTIRADGTGLKRLTNSPACGELGGFPKGTVKVEIENQTTESLFLLYVEGMSTAEVVTISPGTAVMATIPNVADLGNFPQAVTIISGKFRWVDPSVTVDVKPGQTASASTRFVLRSQGNVFANVGAAYPTWHRSGSKVGFLFQEGFMMQIGANPPISGPDSFILAPNAGVVVDGMAWSPVSDWILYAGSEVIGVVQPGASDGGDILINKNPLTEIVIGLNWLPDESGFLFSVTSGQFGPEYSNIYEFNFAANELTALTNFDDEFAGGISLSPDGQQIVFERARNPNDMPELWIMNRDGSGMRSLGINGHAPAWRPGTGIDFTNRILLPMVTDR